MEINETKEYEFVMKVLNLYRRILDLPINHELAEFAGFDGNHEGTYLDCVNHIIMNEDKFTEIPVNSSFGDYNSHVPMVNRYQKMLDEHNRIGAGSMFSHEEALQILNV